MYNRVMLLVILLLVIKITIVVHTQPVCVPKNDILRTEVSCVDLVEVEDYISCLEAE